MVGPPLMAGGFGSAGPRQGRAPVCPVLIAKERWPVLFGVAINILSIVPDANLNPPGFGAAEYGVVAPEHQFCVF